LKPVKAAGKRKISAPVARAVSDSAPKGQPTFDDAMHSIHEKLAIKIEKDARDCEISTREAILAAQPTEKRSAFHSGFDEWRDRLCASATEYYNNCFVIARKNRLQHDYLLSLAKISSTDKLRSPTGFAKGLTEVEISAFLRVTALDREEPAREIDSNGRVREFVRHACDDLSDGHPSLKTEQNTVFRLPQSFDAKWNIKVSLSKLAWRPPGQPPRTPAIDDSGRLSVEDTEGFILGTEGLLVRKLRVVIAEAHREALIILGKIGTATEVPSKAGADAPNLTEKPTPKEKIVFIERNGKTVPSGPIRKIGKETWLNSYEELSQNLDGLRILVQPNGNKASAKQLRKPFRGTYLGSVVTSDEERDELIATLRAGTTAINATLVLLETKTRVKRDSITVYCSEARRARKQKETGTTNHH
jgi:hypothetical protein